MIVTLNEYTLALLCGGVSCLTYILIHMNDISQNDLMKKKKKVPDDDETSSNSDDFSSALRRQSQISARFRAKRAESIKNDHVIFADEIKDDDEKFTPNPDIADSEVEGILQNTAGGVDVNSIGDFEVPELNTFDKSQPLDDLLIRRRSLHSSPANSRSGSRSGSVRICAPDEQADSEGEQVAVDAQDLQVKSLQAQITSLRTEMSNLKAKEDEIMKDRENMEKILQVALGKLYPEKSFSVASDGEKALDDYVEKHL